MLILPFSRFKRTSITVVSINIFSTVDGVFGLLDISVLNGFLEFGILRPPFVPDFQSMRSVGSSRFDVLTRAQNNVDSYIDAIASRPDLGQCQRTLYDEDEQ